MRSWRAVAWGTWALISALAACSGSGEDEASLSRPQGITGDELDSGGGPDGASAPVPVPPAADAAPDAEAARTLPDNCHAPLPPDSEVAFACSEWDTGWLCNLGKASDGGSASPWNFYFGCFVSQYQQTCGCGAEGPANIPLSSSTRPTDAEMLAMWRANCTSVCVDPPPYVPPAPPMLEPDAGALVVNAYTPPSCMVPLPADDDVRVDISQGTGEYSAQWGASVYRADQDGGGSLFDCGFWGEGSQLVCSYNFPSGRSFGPPAGMTPTRESVLAIWRTYWVAACSDYSTNPPACIANADAASCQGHGL